MPPITVATRTPLLFLSRSMASCATCCASSRVGHSTNAAGPTKRCRSIGEFWPLLAIMILCSTGSRKAAVLPLPVWLLTIQSPPCMAAGTASACTGVGWVKPSVSMAFSKGAARPMLANELVCSVIFIPNQENRSRLFNAMVCGQRTSTIRQMPAIPASGAPLSKSFGCGWGRCTVVARPWSVPAAFCAILSLNA